MKKSRPNHYTEDVQECTRLLTVGDLRVNVEMVVPLEGVPEALASIAKMGHRGKIVVAVDKDVAKKARDMGKIR